MIGLVCNTCDMPVPFVDRLKAQYIRMRRRGNQICALLTFQSLRQLGPSACCGSDSSSVSE